MIKQHMYVFAPSVQTVFIGFSVAFSSFVTFLTLPFLANNVSEFTILFSKSTRPETELAQYGVFLGLSFLMYALFMLFAYIDKKHITPLILSLFEKVALGILTYHLITPFPPTFITGFHPFLFLTVLCMLLLLKLYEKIHSPGFVQKLHTVITRKDVISFMAFSVITKYFYYGWKEFDLGVAIEPTSINPNISRPTYLVLFFIFLVYFLLQRTGLTAKKFPFFHFFHLPAFVGTVFMLFLALSVCLTISVWDGVDTYFGIIPAYHFLHGGIPFVSLASVYGYGFLLPWIAFQLLFPWWPLTHQAGMIITLILLLFYAAVMLACLLFIFRKKYLAHLTTISVIYFSILLPSFHFSEAYNFLTFASIAPYRFGAFLFPFLFLSFWLITKKKIALFVFSGVGLLGFFHSFEVGSVLAIAAVVSSSAAILITSKNIPRALFSYALTICIMILVLGSVITGVIYLASGQLPQITYMVIFSEIFSGGYNMKPIDGYIHFAPFVVYTCSMLFAGFLLSKKNARGVGFLYLSIIGFGTLPYFLGRSVTANIYTVSIPMITLLGFFADTLEEGKNVQKFFVSVVRLICVGILLLGTLRVVTHVYTYWQSPEKTFNQIVFIIHEHMTVSNVKNSPEFAFLSTHLDTTCPVVLLDQQDFELLPTLNAKPAFSHSFFRYFVVSKEQVDLMIIERRKKPFCLFVNENELKSNGVTAGVFEYLLTKLQPYSQPIISDKNQGFILYSVKIPDNYGK